MAQNLSRIWSAYVRNTKTPINLPEWAIEEEMEVINLSDKNPYRIKKLPCLIITSKELPKSICITWDVLTHEVKQLVATKLTYCALTFSEFNVVRRDGVANEM
jgi:hypothetical protein